MPLTNKKVLMLAHGSIFPLLSGEWEEEPWTNQTELESHGQIR